MKLKIDWLKNIQENLYLFIQQMNVKNDFSYFKYSYTGDLYDSSIKWGLAQLVFATKILYMIDKIKELKSEHRTNLIQAIISFQNEDTYFTDEIIFNTRKRKIFFDLTKKKKLSIYHEQVKRAETRQAFAALMSLKTQPKYPFLKIPDNKKDIDRYLLHLDWEKPWSAASHFSHLLFFLHYNRKIFLVNDNNADELIDYAIEWINKLQSSSDGCWYQGVVSEPQKINGAMKVLTGLSASERLKFSYPERIVDTSLKIGEATDACNDFNVIYVLYCCSQNSDYRINDIKKFCWKRLHQYKRYYYPDKGGFSFHLNNANDFYYGAKITKGFNEPDIHGTVMFLWGITLISKILDIDLKLTVPLV